VDGDDHDHVLTGPVRPFRGQVVRARWAERALDPVNRDALQQLLDLGAYDASRMGRAFVYSMTAAGSLHAGVVATVDVAGFADGQVRGHEGTQPDRVDGLVRHFDAVDRRSELVSLMHRGDPQVTALVDRVTAAPPLLALADPSGVEQRVWEVEPRLAEDLAAGLSRCRLYIADGHHRVAASVRRWERDGRPSGATVLCAVYPEDHVRLLSFDRRVRGPVDGAALVHGLSEAFGVQPAVGPVRSLGSVGLYAAGRWLRLTLPAAERPAGVAGLDVTMLQEQILQPLLGVGRPGADPRLEFVPELGDLADSVVRCDADGGVLFTVHAPTVQDVVTVADRGEVMSPKSTYLQPKPRTGIFVA